MINKRDKMKKNNCPDIEAVACYVEGILSQEDKTSFEQHLAVCKNCREEIAYQIEVAKQQNEEGLTFAPEYLTERAKNLVSERFGANVLELVVKFTDKAIEVVRTTGDVLFGGRLQPAYALRSKEIELVTTQNISKVFDNISIEIEISRQKDELNKLILRAKDNQAKTPINDLRATLIKKDVELESYITRNGKAIFENIKPGHYAIQISDIEKPIGLIILELNKA